MFKISGLLCLGIAVVCGGLLFQTSQSVQRAEQELTQVQMRVNVEQESLKVLTAEWDYLNRPERLEKLTQENLDLDEPRAEKADFIEEKGSVPEPEPSIIIQSKPKELLQNVSTAKPVVQHDAYVPTIIQNGERKNFDKLLDDKGGKE